MLAFIEALSRFAAAFMEWFQQRQLLEAGRKEVQLEDAKEQIKAQEKIIEISSAPPLSDPQSILNKL